MRIANIIVRSLLGALFTFSALAYFFNLIPTPELSGDMKIFTEGLAASGYLMPLLKGTELICGIALLIGRFVPLALLILSPIAINILGVHLALAPEGLPVAIFVVGSILFLAYVQRQHYASLFQSR